MPLAERDPIDAARAAGRRSLGEDAAKALTAECGIAVPRGVVVRNAGEVDAAIARLRGPFAVKVLAPAILHKSDAGAVILGVQGAAGVRAAIEKIAAQPQVRNARVEGYLVEEMCAPGVEMVVGAVHDPRFGAMLMAGLGGIYVEILRDVSFRLCPIDRADAHAMLDELRGIAILAGARGREPIDREPLVDLLVKVGGAGGFLERWGAQVEELDLNPVIVGAEGAVAADARVILSERARADDRAGEEFASDEAVRARFAPLFEPRTVAVVGASSSSTTIANTFIRRLKDFGYRGAIYPIHPKAGTIEGLPCHPDLAHTPEPVDYAYIAIGARSIPDVLRRANGRLGFAQVISSGFGEVADGVALEAELVAAAREGGCRLVGPNCLGLYSPRGGVTFPVGAPAEVGSVGVLTQSGGLGTDIIKRGQWRGLRFSGLVTIGNSAEIGPADLLEFYLADPTTKVIGLYLEDVKDGRRFFELLRRRGREKPVVILRGGRSAQGREAAASHTGALAGDNRAWECLATQAPCAMVSTVDEMIDSLLAFQHLSPRPHPTSRVVLFGNGGGTSVLATDTFADCGLDVARFDASTLQKLEAMNLPPGTSVTNPIDAPVATMQEQGGLVANKILDIVYDSAPDAVVMHLNLAAFVGRGDSDPVDNLIQGAIRAREARRDGPHFLLALRVDGSPELEERRRHYRAIASRSGIPVYEELEPVAKALRAVSRIERHRARKDTKS